MVAAISQSHTRTPSTSSQSSDEPIAYAEDVAPLAPKVVRTTRQARDWRPRSTLHLKKFNEMSFAEKVCSLALTPETIHELKDEDLDRGPIPGINALADNAWILCHALIPVALQLASYTLFPEYQWPIRVAYPIYLFFFARFMTSTLARLNAQAVKLGTFDEKNVGRDRMPDNAAVQLARAILVTPVLRTGGAFWFYYAKEESPLDGFGWTLPLRMGAYMLAVDYFFYTYHRSTHEFDFLWFIHQRHHTTKHPSPILSIIADDYQEILEIAVVPFIATVLVPMSFHELYLTLCYCVFTEIGGHSGVRTHGGHPLLHYPLHALGMELIIEDHDLHHRNGKSGKAYGKHTQVWDKLFGTKGTRIETLGM